MTPSKATSRTDLSLSTCAKRLAGRITGLKAPSVAGIIRVEVETDAIDPLDWLVAQDFDTRLYWR
ncbi:MAG: hypothetical protein JSU65_03475, partial [Candidatus Zixiibacteriota bacterium]